MSKTTTKTQQLKFAPHEFSFETNTGLFRIVVDGNFSGEQMDILLDALEKHRAEHSTEPLFLLVDIRRAARFSREARMIIANRTKEKAATTYIGIFGGSLTARVIVGMTLKGMSAIAKRYQVMTVWLAEETDARVWLGVQRRRHFEQKT